MKNTFKNKKSGFLEIVVIVFVAVIVLAIFGFNPKMIWTDYALPILQFIWDVFLAILGFIVDLAIKLADTLSIINIANNKS